MRPVTTMLGLSGLFSQQVLAITLDLSSEQSIKQAASIAAAGMVHYYGPNGTEWVPGQLPEPVYWWSSTGAMFDSLVGYWYLTGDEQYNNITSEALLFSAGPNWDFVSTTGRVDITYSDQTNWALAALSAAETGFPEPADESQREWLFIAEAAFDYQMAAWGGKSDTCLGGGLDYAIFPTSPDDIGYWTSETNGLFFQFGARLARLTGEPTYAEWAERAWNWSSAVGLIDDEYQVYDFTQDLTNCSVVERPGWSTAVGSYLAGAATMYNLTDGASVWEERVRGLIKGLDAFLVNNTLTDWCDMSECDGDWAFPKGMLTRWIASTVVRAPFTHDILKPILGASAQGAAEACNIWYRDVEGDSCDSTWIGGGRRSGDGPGQQMSVLEVFQANLIDYVDKSRVTSPGASDHPTNTGAGALPPNSAGLATIDGSLLWVIMASALGIWFIETI